jgi:sulfite exporter TauE/SafE
MVLPALSLPSQAVGKAFLGMFLVGTVLAMGSYTAFVSSLSKALQKRVPKITHRLTVGSSLGCNRPWSWSLVGVCELSCW